MARSGEAAQNQRPLLIGPRGDELFGHQIHPVVKRCDQAKIGRAIIRLDLFVAVMPLQEYNRLPSTRAETAVDAIHFLLYFRRQILITLNVRPAGRADLNKREMSLIRRELLEKSFNSAEALRNAFGIVD